MATKAKPAAKPSKGKTPPKPENKKPPGKKKTPKQPPEVKYDTPEALAKYDAEFFRKGTELYDALKASQAEHLRLKEKAADAKKLFEAARIEHEEHTANGRKWRGQKPPGVQQDLPFERQASPAVDGGPIAPSPSPVAFTPDAPHADLWRQFPLDRWTVFGCTPSDIQKLAEGKLKKETGSFPITTVGEFSDFTKPFASDPTRNRQHTDIKGIGAEGATRISDAEIRFWNEWNTKGLREEFAREKGVNLNPEKAADANGETQPAGGKRTAGDAGGDGDKPSKPASPRRRKPHAAKSNGKGKAKPKPVEQPDAERHPATVPFTASDIENDIEREAAEATAAG